MPIEFVAKASRRSLPVHVVAKDRLADAGSRRRDRAWAEANGFTGEAGRVLVLPGADGAIGGALFGLGKGDDEFGALGFGALARHCPRATGISPRSSTTRRWPRSASRSAPINSRATARSLAARCRFALPKGADAAHVERVCDAVFLTRDLVNTPTNDMGPDALEQAVRSLAAKHKAKVSVIEGDALLQAEFPDDPCGRPRLGRGAAADRYASGATRTRPR